MQLKQRADSANMRINRYIHKELLQKKHQPYYFYNLIIVLLESISTDLQNNNCNENTTKIFFYLYLIEQILEEKL